MTPALPKWISAEEDYRTRRKKVTKAPEIIRARFTASSKPLAGVNIFDGDRRFGENQKTTDFRLRKMGQCCYTFVVGASLLDICAFELGRWKNGIGAERGLRFENACARLLGVNSEQENLTGAKSGTEEKDYRKKLVR